MRHQLLTLVSPPEVVALIGDDWETNPQTLELLRILREPDGNRKIMEAGLQRGADAYGVSFEDALASVCLHPDVSLESKLALARIAHIRGMPGTILLFAALDRV